MSLSKEELDKTAQEYHQQDILEDKHIEGACQEYSFDWVFGHIDSSDKVLEMGYGDGLFSKALQDRKINFSLLEGAASLVQSAKSLYPQISVYHELFEEFAPSEKFDLILATHVLEHVDDPVALLQRMKSWIQPNGRILIIVPNQESIHRRLAVIMGLQPQLDTLGKRDLLVGHQRVYSLQTLEEDLTQAGFQVMDRTGFFLKTLPNSMMKEYSPELIQALNVISSELPPQWLANIGVLATLTT